MAGSALAHEIGIGRCTGEDEIALRQHRPEGGAVGPRPRDMENRDADEPKAAEPPGEVARVCGRPDPVDRGHDVHLGAKQLGQKGQRTRTSPHRTHAVTQNGPGAPPAAGQVSKSAHQARGPVFRGEAADQHSVDRFPWRQASARHRDHLALGGAVDGKHGNQMPPRHQALRDGLQHALRAADARRIGGRDVDDSQGTRSESRPRTTGAGPRSCRGRRGCRAIRRERARWTASR
jgi:hypothetical protein